MYSKCEKYLRPCIQALISRPTSTSHKPVFPLIYIIFKMMQCVRIRRTWRIEDALTASRMHIILHSKCTTQSLSLSDKLSLSLSLSLFLSLSLSSLSFSSPSLFLPFSLSRSLARWLLSLSLSLPLIQTLTHSAYLMIFQLRRRTTLCTGTPAAFSLSTKALKLSCPSDSCHSILCEFSPSTQLVITCGFCV